MKGPLLSSQYNLLSLKNWFHAYFILYILLPFFSNNTWTSLILKYEISFFSVWTAVTIISKVQFVPFLALSAPPTPLSDWIRLSSTTFVSYWVKIHNTRVCSLKKVQYSLERFQTAREDGLRLLGKRGLIWNVWDGTVLCFDYLRVFDHCLTMWRKWYISESVEHPELFPPIVDNRGTLL